MTTGICFSVVLSSFVLGRKNENACKGAPKTCALLEKFSETTGCRRGQVPRVFSEMGRRQFVVRKEAELTFTKITVISLGTMDVSFPIRFLMKHNFMWLMSKFEGRKCWVLCHFVGNETACFLAPSQRNKNISPKGYKDSRMNWSWFCCLSTPCLIDDWVSYFRYRSNTPSCTLELMCGRIQDPQTAGSECIWG